MYLEVVSTFLPGKTNLRPSGKGITSLGSSVLNCCKLPKVGKIAVVRLVVAVAAASLLSSSLSSPISSSSSGGSGCDCDKLCWDRLAICWEILALLAAVSFLSDKFPGNSNKYFPFSLLKLGRPMALRAMKMS